LICEHIELCNKSPPALLNWQPMLQNRGRAALQKEWSNRAPSSQCRCQRGIGDGIAVAKNVPSGGEDIAAHDHRQKGRDNEMETVGVKDVKTPAQMPRDIFSGCRANSGHGV
jgi:hypothetical protein